MIVFILVFALAAGLAWACRRKGPNVVRLAPRSPFPPYDWFTHESAPEDPDSSLDENSRPSP